MVGEIRDTETAEHAVQAALTGHLVLSTLHTNDAPSSVTRLLDLRIPNFLILSTVIGIVAQRLVRVNCTHCAEPHAPTAEEAVALGISLDELAARPVRRGAGCLHCRQTGYAGRDGVFQVMPMSERLRGLIARQASSLDLVEAARGEGMRTLREAAIEKVLSGVTTVSEMVRVTGGPNL
jgi:general secretion pathway protein E